jgi:hypothetical protein
MKCNGHELTYEYIFLVPDRYLHQRHPHPVIKTHSNPPRKHFLNVLINKTIMEGLTPQSRKSPAFASERSSPTASQKSPCGIRVHVTYHRQILPLCHQHSNTYKDNSRAKSTVFFRKNLSGSLVSCQKGQILTSASFLQVGLATFTTLPWLTV